MVILKNKISLESNSRLEKTIMINQVGGENVTTQEYFFPSDSILTERFRIIRLLGTGGMGNVYLAEDVQLSRYVAIKTIRPELSANEEVKKRIAHECRMHAAIGIHPNIVALYDRIEENSNIYLIMEYADGVLLTELLSSDSTFFTTLDIGKVTDIIVQILNGLSAIHQKDIIHREVKPANVIVSNIQAGKLSVKFMDFGIARAEIEDLGMTRLTMLDVNGPGTPLYMAPERIDSKAFGNLCAATDLYSVGVILFQMLSDGPPFRGTMTEIFIGHLTSPPDLALLKADTPLKLKAVVETALKKKLTERYITANDFINDIKKTIDPRCSHYTEEISNEKTLLVTGSCVTLSQSRTNFSDTGKPFFLFQLIKNRDKLLAGGLIVILVVVSFVVRHSWDSRVVENTKATTEQKVLEQPEVDSQMMRATTDVKAMKTADDTNTQELPEENTISPAPALNAFESSRNQASKIIDNNKGVEKQSSLKKTVHSIQKNQETNVSTNCQSLLRSWRPGDASTMQQYRRECVK
jgi:serine/threonine protein kinase